jgi:hypothetical protein
MPVFNERATIEAAIERVLSVDVPVDHLELIVVDDGSSDGTRELLEGGGWPENVRLLSHEQNRGKARLSGPASRKPAASTARSWTPIWSTTRPTPVDGVRVLATLARCRVR